MKRRHRVFLKLNLVSLFFIAVSLISISLAWFAYSGLAKVQTEIDVKSWLIEFQGNKKSASNNIVISLNKIYPGMQTVHESVKILNKGDSEAMIDYEIISASIFDESLSQEDDLIDKVSHDYPFNINMSLSRNYLAPYEEDISTFDVSISWPLDSGNDELDSEWGNRAYQFQKDNEANPLPAIRIVIQVKAEQYLEEDDSPDPKYLMGNIVLYDIENNSKCNRLSSTCILTHVIDANNKISDDVVTLLPDLRDNYSQTTFDNYNSNLPSINGTLRNLKVEDLLKVISNDIIGSHIIYQTLSNSIIGSTHSDQRIQSLITKTVSNEGFFRFLNETYDYLETSDCVWLYDEYDQDNGFALKKIDDGFSKIYKESKDSNCKIVPVIEVNKENLK